MAEPSLSRGPFAYTCDFDPMPFEVDFTGYLSNTVVIRWMEMLRVRMMRMHFSEIDTGARQYLSVITKTEIEYINAVRYGEGVSGTAWIDDVAGARWQIGFRFENKSQQRLAISARQGGTFLNPASLRPVRVPEIIRGRFLAHRGAVT
jgi:acyl-CoA thioester hydrolase